MAEIAASSTRIHRYIPSILWQNDWGDLKCLQKSTNQMELDGGLFPYTV